MSRPAHRNFQCAACGTLVQLDHAVDSYRCTCGRWMEPWHPLAVAPSEPVAELREYDRMMRESSTPLDART